MSKQEINNDGVTAQLCENIAYIWHGLVIRTILFNAQVVVFSNTMIPSFSVPFIAWIPTHFSILVCLVVRYSTQLYMFDCSRLTAVLE